MLIKFLLRLLQGNSLPKSNIKTLGESLSLSNVLTVKLCCLTIYLEKYRNFASLKTPTQL